MNDEGLGVTIRAIIGAFIVVFMLVLFPSDFVQAEEYSQRSYTAVKVDDDSPVIDGLFTEKIWQKAEWEKGFVQREPYEGVDPTQKTSFKILYDNDNIYVAIKAYDTEIDKIERRLTRRDAFEGDWVGIAFDSYFDKLTAFSFAVSASGVKNDLLVSNEDQMDETWDPVWYVKTTIDDEGWNAEMKIPLTQIRFAKIDHHVWGMQVMRSLFRKEEFSNWQHIPQESSRWVSKFGELVGINGITPKKDVEFIPYVMGNIETFEKEEGNPFQDGSKLGYSAGVDGKIAVSNDLTLNFTVNPDFGQVEADPSQVNLTAFEVFFPEQRPFFIEGSNIYDYPLAGGDGEFAMDNVFYSRRIGRTPQYDPELDDNEYIDDPEFTRILGAFKLSGKTRNGWSVGVLESVTNKEVATIDNEGTQREETVEPLTNYFNTRLQKDFDKGNTIVGGMVTATNRQILDDSLNFLPNSAYTGGLDFQNFWKDKSYFLGLKGVFSQVNGSTEAITELQENPRRYFQRPDASHLSVDTNLTSLTGHGGTIEGGKIGGGHWRYVGWVTWRSPGLDLNDQGFLRQADIIQQILWAQYRIWEPFSIFRNFNINFNQWSEHDFAGTRLVFGGNTNVHMQFTNYWSFSTGLNLSGSSIDRAELRGGPALKYPGDFNNWLSIESDERKKLVSRLSMFNNWGHSNSSRFFNLSLAFTYRPINALALIFQPSYHKGFRQMQWVETIEMENEDRYIISDLDRDRLSADFRVNLNITPDLTIQYWGQPFMFTGDYTRFKRVTDPMADQFEDRFHIFTEDEIFYDSNESIYQVDENQDGTIDYTFDDPNFSFYEFRSNLVLRWEYIPGSTVYLVWSQGRTGENSYGEFNINENVDNLFSIAPRNVFQVKFSYRISI